MTSSGTVDNDIPSLSLSFHVSETDTVALTFQGCYEDLARSWTAVADSSVT